MLLVNTLHSPPVVDERRQVCIRVHPQRREVPCEDIVSLPYFQACGGSGTNPSTSVMKTEERIEIKGGNNDWFAEVIDKNRESAEAISKVRSTIDKE